ncbi:MAG: hypothetical protein RR061_00075 [Muribaculaceae bacterium]
MNSSIVISENVINTISSLQPDEQKAVFNAFACDKILKVKRDFELSPLQEILYAIVCDYIKRDSLRYSNSIREQTMA